MYRVVTVAREYGGGGGPVARSVAERLLRPVILRGKLVQPLPDPKSARSYAAESLARMRLDKPLPVEYSRGLKALLASVKMELKETIR
jgi:hypothetical protein